MRRLLSLSLILLLAFGLSACADPSPEQPDTPDAPADPAPEQPDTPDAPADPAPEQPDTPDAPADTPLHYDTDGFYLPHIQAYTEGFISSQKCGIPVMIGSNGGPIGG